MCIKEKTCKICTRDVIDDGDKFCDDCIDFFINYFDNTEFQKCTKSNQCLNVPSLEILNCEQCRVKKCLRSGMNYNELMGPPVFIPEVPPPTQSVPFDKNAFINSLLDSLKELNKKNSLKHLRSHFNSATFFKKQTHLINIFLL
uniref:Nuclear receptor domain-containing protein n=1 Tax=Panagrolaimus superbus TaxID=310955 RepID=A0A914YDR4_9BILA